MPNCSTIADLALLIGLDELTEYVGRHRAPGDVYADDAPDGVDWWGLHRAPEHVHNLVEVGLTDECEYGCKILACSAGDTQPVVSHRAVYGCPQG